MRYEFGGLYLEGLFSEFYRTSVTGQFLMARVLVCHQALLWWVERRGSWQTLEDGEGREGEESTPGGRPVDSCCSIKFRK